MNKMRILTQYSSPYSNCCQKREREAQAELRLISLSISLQSLQSCFPWARRGLCSSVPKETSR